MKPARVERVPLTRADQIDGAILSFVTQGYVLVQRTSTSAIVQKKREFEVAWAIIGFFFCLTPLVIYLFYYLFLQPEAEVREIFVWEG